MGRVLIGILAVACLLAAVYLALPVTHEGTAAAEEVVVAGGWFSLGVAAVLLAREAWRGRPRGGAGTAEGNPTHRPR